MATHQPTASPGPEPGLARRALAWRALAAADQCLAWPGRHPRLTDAGLVAVLFWLCGSPVHTLREGRQAGSLVLLLAMLLPLIWRRQAPMLVLVVIGAGAVVRMLTSRELTYDVALLVAFYTVAAHERPRRVLAGAVVLEIGAGLAAARNVSVGLDAFWSWVLLSGLVCATGLAGWYARSRRARLAGLAEHARRLERDRDQQAQLAASAERERIAREMHDIVAHNIAVMIALADGAAYTAADSPAQAVTLMGEVSSAGRSALSEMRRLLGVLRQPAGQPMAPQPTLADVDELLATFRAAGLSVRLSVTGAPGPLPPSAELALYRMIQEALTNTLKHAPGATALVRLSHGPGQVGLEVTDSGRPESAGAPPTVTTPAETPAGGAPGAGHGLAGMRERAAVFGAEVTAGPGPDGGWRVRTLLRLDPVPPDSGPAAAAESR